MCHLSENRVDAIGALSIAGWHSVVSAKVLVARLHSTISCELIHVRFLPMKRTSDGLSISINTPGPLFVRILFIA